MDRLSHVLAVLPSATSEVAWGVWVALQIAATASVPSILLRRRGRPTSAIAWLLVLFAFPGLGTCAWWLFGRNRIERRRRKHQRTMRSLAEKVGVPETTRGTLFESLVPARAHGDHAFMTGGNLPRLLADGEAAFSEIDAALRSATECVNLLFYIWKTDATGLRLCDLLIECAKRGVVVRLLLDGFGSRDSARSLTRLLTPHGIKVGVFFPARFWPFTPRLNFVNHRKLITVDHRVGFVGGMNIGDEYRFQWRDLMVRVEGPLVKGLNHVFLEDWYFATNEALEDPPRQKPIQTDDACDSAIISSGPDTEDWIHDAYFLTITQAKRRLYISTPYFIPTQALMTALCTTAGRGVDVRLLLPSSSDVGLVMWASRSFYRPLISSGVRIFEYSGPMLHAKALVMDENVVAIGSANVDNRSLRLNFELMCFFAQERLAEQVALWLFNLGTESEEITAAALNKKGTPRKLIESAAHLLSPLL